MCGEIVKGIYSHSSIPEGGWFQDPSGCQNLQMLNSHAMGFPYAPILHPQIQATRMVWYFLSHVVNEAEVDVFVEFSCFFCDSMVVGNLISGSSAFSKSSLNI